ncbi:MAG: HD domain-containing protein [Cellulosilyticum sp.]|nr:HD domain-containing protein [Cellulosilyticum sp.]
MQKILVPLSETMPGMLVAEPIRNLETGLIYVGENQELTADIIQKLERSGIEEIKIYVNTWDDVWKISEETKEHYQRCTDKAKKLLNQIAYDNVVDFVAFKQVKEEMIKYFNDNYKMIGCINLSKVAASYTYTHSINVALLATLIGKWMKLGEQAQDQLMLAGLFHDIGKMRINKDLLNKPEKLTDEEFEEIKKHPIYSYEFLQDNTNIPLDVKVGILMHHERMDGSGYPYGVHNENINTIARIIAVADAYDAMISERPYQKKRSPFEVMHLLQEGIFGKLDTKILLTFLSNIATYYIGTYVALNTGEIGEVVAINPSCVYRPIIRVQDRYIDMNADFTVQIVDLS